MVGEEVVSVRHRFSPRVGKRVQVSIAELVLVLPCLGTLIEMLPPLCLEGMQEAWEFIPPNTSTKYLININ